MSRGTLRSITRARARLALVQHHHLHRDLPAGKEGVRKLLDRLRMIQLDPLDAIGTNADLVAFARVPGIKKGDVYRHLLPNYAFEHFAKERCLIGREGFSYYQAMVADNPGFRVTKRVGELPEALLTSVRRELSRRGPLRIRELKDRGTVTPDNFSGWKSSSRASNLAVQALFLRCEAVVVAREGKQRVWHTPEGAWGTWKKRTAAAFPKWALLERVKSAGLLSETSGPWWGALKQERKGALVERMLRAGSLERLQITGDKRTFLAEPGFGADPPRAPDARMRILGPLDPLIWDRRLLAHAFGFEYVWEVYKPKPQRTFGWYVCPLLHRGQMVGRLSARVSKQTLVVDQLWQEPGRRWSQSAFEACLSRHATHLSAHDFTIAR